MTKKNVTPPEGVPAVSPSGSSQRAMRRVGVRHEVSERVVMRALAGVDERGAAVEGWALNVSRGGLRVIIEEKGLNLGGDFEITVGEDEVSRRGRIVWIQEEPDGAIVGIEFTSMSGLHKSVPPAPLTSRRLPGTATEGDGSGEKES